MHLVENDISGAICDCLLVMSIVIKRFDNVSQAPELAKLDHSTSGHCMSFLPDCFPGSIQKQHGSQGYLLDTTFNRTFGPNKSYLPGLKKTFEDIFIIFAKQLNGAWSPGAAGSWSYDSLMIHQSFQKFAIGVENSLATHCRSEFWSQRRSPDTTPSIVGSQSPSNAGSVTPSRRDIGSNTCFKCRQIGHWSYDCPEIYVSVEAITSTIGNISLGGYQNSPSRDKTSDICFKCNQTGHWTSDCPQNSRSTGITAHDNSITSPSRTYNLTPPR